VILIASYRRCRSDGVEASYDHLRSGSDQMGSDHIYLIGVLYTGRGSPNFRGRPRCRPQGAVLCIIQCLLHSHASIESGDSEYRLSEIIFFALLKHLSHSADIAGIDRASNARRVRLGHRFAWSFQ
jgi:hypothetical protein